MIGLSAPISKLLVTAHNHKGLVKVHAIEHQIDDLIDIISFRLQSKSFDVVAESIYEKLFDLRFEIIQWYYLKNENKDFFNALQIKVNQEIASKLQLSPYSELAANVASILDVYSQIISPIIDKADLTKFKGYILYGNEDNKPVYHAFSMFQLHPSPIMRYLKKWIDASLNLEFGLLTAELVLTNAIEMSNDKIDDLIEFLNRSIIHYGAYSIFTDFWRPSDDNNSTLINKMEILAATIELDNKIYYKKSKEDLYRFIHN